MPQRITPEQYQRSRANGWTDDDLVKMGYELPSSAAPRVRPGLPAAAPVDATGPRAGGGGLQPVADIARMAAQGASMGWADEGVAALRALSPNTTYAEAAADEQRKVDEARQKLGSLATVAELAGGLPVSVGVGARIASKIPATVRGAGLLRQAVAGGISGGVAGGITGAGSARVGEKARGAVIGGAGGLFGGALLSGLLYPLGRSARRYTGTLPERKDELASEAMQEVVDRSGVTGANAARIPGRDFDPKTAEFAAGLQQARQQRPLPKDMRLMDMSDDLQELSVDAAKGSNRADKTLEAVANARRAAQNTELTQDVASAIGGKTGVENQQIVDRIADRLKSYEDVAYPDLWTRYPDAISTPDMTQAWATAQKHFPSDVKALFVNRELADEALSDVAKWSNAINDFAPTMQGAHELKSSLGGALSTLRAQEAAQNLSPEGKRYMRSLSIFQDRLRDALQNAPGGAEYAKIQDVGARLRASQEAVDNGAALIKASQKSPYEASRALAEAQRATKSSGDALRQGAIGQVEAKARNMPPESDALLRELEEPATQDVVGTLAKRPSDFAQRVADRRAMATTNELQRTKNSRQKEILKGARSRGVALQFAESRALSGQGGIGGVAGAARTALGALTGKAFAKQRGEAVDAAAVDLARLLMQKTDDPAMPLQVYDMALALKMLKQRRLQNQGGTAAALASLFARRDQ